MQQAWRFIPPIEASGFQQMAIDEWLLEQHRLGRELPCLRFYTWAPTAISLGYHQRNYPEYWHTLRWNHQPLDVVRRPTGGRAVLHQGDLTYGLVVSGYQGRRRDIYRHLCQFLIDGWQALGIDLHLGTDNHRYQRSANCFGSSTAADLVMDNGYKVIGSAQLYRDSCILQHGSMRLAPDPELTKAVFGTAASPTIRLGSISPTDLVTTLMSTAQNVFGIQWELKPLSLQERTIALDWALARQTPRSVE